MSCGISRRGYQLERLRSHCARGRLYANAQNAKGYSALRGESTEAVMHIGYDGDSGHVYEGANLPEFAVVPAPLLTQARLVESPSDLTGLPRGVRQTPLTWVFREQSFDPVTRIRRGRLYEPYTHGQPETCLTRGHPAHQFSHHRQGESLSKTLFHYWPCQTILNKPRAGSGLLFALGQSDSWSMWRIVQVERVVGDDVLVTLKALAAFGVLPDLRVDAIEEKHRDPVQRAVDRVLDSAFRESAISVIDQCRNAAVVLVGRWMVSRGADEKTLELDLGSLVRRVREVPYGLAAVAGVAEMIARLAHQGLVRIGELFKVEAEVNGRSALRRRRMR